MNPGTISLPKEDSFEQFIKRSMVVSFGDKRSFVPTVLGDDGKRLKLNGKPLVGGEFPFLDNVEGDNKDPAVRRRYWDSLDAIARE